MLFDKNNFFNHFSRNNQNKSFIVDYGGNQWVWLENINLYEQVGTGIRKDPAQFQLMNLMSYSDSSGPQVTSITPINYDVARFAIPDNQVTDQSSFDVDVVVGMIDPSVSIVAPTLSVNGTSISTAKTWLTYPGTTTESTYVYRGSVPLAIGENVVTVRQDDSTTHSIGIKRKESLTIVGVTNDSDLVNAIESLYSGDGLATDVIECGYDIPDIVSATSSLTPPDWSSTDRTTFCTLRPASGFSVGWDREDGNSGNLWSPNLTLIKFENINIGSTGSAESSNKLTAIGGSKHWFNNCTISAKYSFDSYGFDYTAGVTNAVANPAPDAPENYDVLISDNGDGSHIAYFTNNTIQGCWSPFGPFAISRDNTWIEHRHDVNRFGLVSLNQRIQSIKPIARPGNTDWTHCDLLQRWGSNLTQPNRVHENLYYAGFSVEGLDSHYQAFLIDAVYGGSTSTLDKCIIRDFDLTSVIQSGVFFATSGTFTDVLIDSISYPNGYLDFRYDVGAAVYTNTQFKNCSFYDVRFNYSGTIDDITYNVSNVVSRSDISSELNAESVGSFTYPTFNGIGVGPGRFSEYKSDSSIRWRTGSGGVFDASVQIDGLTELQVYDAGSFSSLFFIFSDESSRNTFIGGTGGSPEMTLVVTGVELGHVNYGTSYTYTIPSGNVSSWPGTAARVLSSNMTGSKWPGDAENLWGNNPTYTLTI